MQWDPENRTRARRGYKLRQALRGSQKIESDQQKITVTADARAACPVFRDRERMLLCWSFAQYRPRRR